MLSELEQVKMTLDGAQKFQIAFSHASANTRLV